MNEGRETGMSAWSGRCRTCGLGLSGSVRVEALTCGFVYFLAFLSMSHGGINKTPFHDASHLGRERDTGGGGFGGESKA